MDTTSLKFNQNFSTESDTHELFSRELVPSGLRAVAALFALLRNLPGDRRPGMLSQPRMISVAAGAPLLFGLEIAGPYMFLLTGIASIGIAYGLVRRINLVRHAAILLAIAGVVLLIWDVAAAARTVQLRALTLGGLGVIVPSLSQQFRSA